jgi:hypothetical protein
MREIKFRAWDKKNKKWITTFNLVGGGRWSFLQGKPEEYEIVQFTGLKDKNGKEIYEGDVLLSPGNYKWEVKFEGQGYIPSCMDEFELIGNIYESPDLLKT